MGNTFTTQRTKQLKTPTKWTFDFLVNLLFKLLEFLQDANVINKDAIAAQIDQAIQVLELMDLGPWINFWKRLEDKLKLNKHLEPLVAIYLPGFNAQWMPSKSSTTIFCQTC